MFCPKCNGMNVSVQAVTETQLKTKHRSIIWWLLIGWWWLFFKWFFLTVPAIIVKIFAPKRYKLKQRHVSKAVCQSCGYMWNP